MGRPVVVLAVALLLAGVAAALVVGLGSDRARFTAAEAEATVRRALERCDHELSDARRVDCEEAGRGFACRADGRLVASFNEPDPERPEFKVVC